MFSHVWHYFTDPVLQAPTVGSMLMCFSSALVGVIVFLRKRSLLGEALSHAAYPGVVMSVFVIAAFFPTSDLISVAILIGASLTSLIGLWVIDKMERRFQVKNDAALCFVLSVFFGVGVLIASQLQISHALLYKSVQIFLYGQAATMTDVHVWIYAMLGIVVVAILLCFYRQIAMAVFDREFAKAVGVRVGFVDTMLFVLLVLAIVIGIRSVGVVLMAGMLIAPAVAARQWSHRLWLVLLLAAVIGAVSGFLGNYFSIELPGEDAKFSLPTGPMILLVCSSIALCSLLFSPQSGLVSRLLRAARFRRQCLAENALKVLWKQSERKSLSFDEIRKAHSLSFFSAYFLLLKLVRQGWVHKKGGGYQLTGDGRHLAARIVRLHRLWEVYLVSLGQGVEKVHRSAEEMEHIITPELEKELVELLNNPKHDPHHQPIPDKGDVL
jgi:manganese/zinc/iron transport system permease protein